MRRSVGIIVVAVAALLADVGAIAAPLSPAALAAVDKVGRDWVAAGHAPGMTLGVMQDGKVVFMKAYGQAQLENKVPVRPGTVFRVGSISKQFTAAAVLKLVEEGRLSLDDKLAKYYPDIPHGDEVTIRQMLNHTSGLHNYIEVGPDPRAMLPLMMDHTTDAWATHIADQKPLFDFAPGTAFHYSNAGYFLAGGIVEKVSGQPLSAYLKDHIFKPAGLTDTALDVDGPIVPLRASGYEIAPKEPGGYRTANYLSLTVAGGAGAMRSTASDLLKWQEALLSGKVIGPAFLKELLAPGRLNNGRLASETPFPAPKADTPASERADYGMGLYVGAVDGHRRVSHGGNIYGFNAALDSYPEDHLAWVALSNTGAGVAGLDRKIEAALFTGPEKGRPAPQD